MTAFFRIFRHWQIAFDQSFHVRCPGASKKCYGHYFWIWCNPFINCYRSARRFARSSGFRQCINLVKAKISNGYIIIEMKKRKRKRLT